MGGQLYPLCPPGSARPAIIYSCAETLIKPNTHPLFYGVQPKYKLCNKCIPRVSNKDSLIQQPAKKV